MMFKNLGYSTLIFLNLSLIGCQLHTPVKPEIPDEMLKYQPLVIDTNSSLPGSQTEFWWENFEDSDLNRLVGIYLSNNLSLKSAVSRLIQAREVANIQGSAQYPSIALGIGSSRNRAERPGSQITGQESAPDFKRIFNTYSLGLQASYELDLWRRIDSLTSSANIRAEAVNSDLQALVSMLLAETARSWIDLRLQSSLYRLVHSQIRTSKTYLDLTRMRFQLGLTNALDVLQQETQLKSLEALLPSIDQQITRGHSRISNLMGMPKSTLYIFPMPADVYHLPPFPKKLRGVDLLTRRPDLLAKAQRAYAAEYEIAAAIADRFPRLNLDLSYSFSTEDLDILFESESGSAGIDFLLPIFDGGRRRAAVRLEDARSDELLYDYQQGFIEALNEVSQLVLVEKQKNQQLLKIADRYSASKNTLTYSQERYQNGALDYLQVLLALQSTQEIERAYLQERASILQNRISIHQALGQPWRVIQTEDGPLKIVVMETQD